VLYLVKSRAKEVTGKTVIKPAAKLMAKVMVEDEVSRVIDDSLSNNNVHCRIKDMVIMHCKSMIHRHCEC
jgi:hypothetical protein